MAPPESCDLLSLDSGPAEAQKPSLEAQDALAAPSVATSAAASDTAAGADLFDDDDWDGFQSAQPAQALAADSADPFSCFGETDSDKVPADRPAVLGDDCGFDPLAQLFGEEAPVAAAAPVAGGAPVVTEESEPLELDIPVSQDPEKKMISVYYKGEKNVVGWYADMKAADIREAVMCACDAIIDRGFVLREVELAGDDESDVKPKEDGRVLQFEDFDELQSGHTYIIEAAEERKDLKSITGDRWRRLKVQIEPLLHVEAQQAIDRMRRGSNLLKHTHYGFPHLRQFQLSDDRKRLIWYSGNKGKDDSVVQMDEVSEIRLGQSTPTFLHYRLPMLEHLSFSLVYGPKGKTLDLTCKDEFEFDHWVTGLKAVLYHFKNRQISKQELLGHSKRFKKAVEKSNCGIKLTRLPEVKEKGQVSLDDCIEIAAHTPAQLDAKMIKLRERLREMSLRVARLDHHAAAEMEVDLSILAGQGPAYASVFVQDEDAQDEEMETRRLHELVDQTTQAMQQAQQELTQLRQKRQEGSEPAKAKKKHSAACKQIDQLLWKAEVDLENMEDMFTRHEDNQKDTATQLSVSIAEFNRQLSAKMEEVRCWFG